MVSPNGCDEFSILMCVLTFRLVVCSLIEYLGPVLVPCSGLDYASLSQATWEGGRRPQHASMQTTSDAQGSQHR